MAHDMEPKRLVFVDEMGTNTSLSPLRAWSRRGERARGAVPRNRGKNTTLLSSMGVEGMGPSLAIIGAVDARVFEAYLERVLLPELHPGRILRKAEARTREALVEALGPALSSVTEEDARGFFEHCGYSTLVQ